MTIDLTRYDETQTAAHGMADDVIAQLRAELAELQETFQTQLHAAVIVEYEKELSVLRAENATLRATLKDETDGRQAAIAEAARLRTEIEGLRSDAQAMAKEIERYTEAGLDYQYAKYLGGAQ